MQEYSDQVNMEWFIFVMLYEDLLYFSINVSSGGC
jgi:hypothetical protein